MPTMIETNGLMSMAATLGVRPSGATFQWYPAAPCKGVLTLVARNSAGVQVGATKHINLASLSYGQAIFRATSGADGTGALDAANYLDVTTASGFGLELSVAGKVAGHFAAEASPNNSISASGNGQGTATVTEIFYESGGPGGGG